jgi:hypothetical protein
MARSIASLFSGVSGIDDSALDAFKTPEQVREEQLDKLRERSTAQATLLGNIGQRASTALPGIFGSFAASQLPEMAVDLNQATRRGLLGAGSIAGAAGRPGVQQALQQAAVSPGERQAGATQEALRQLQGASPEEMMAVARELQQRGNVQGSQAIMQMAREAQLSQAELESEKALTAQRLAKTQETLMGMQPSATALDFAGQNLSDILGIQPNILQSFDTASVQKANQVRLQGPLEGESNADFINRINTALTVPAEQVLSQGEGAAVPFSEFLGISDAQLRDYSTGSRKRARQLYAEGAKEGETQAQFQKRILDTLLVGLSPEQKKQAEVWARSAETAVRGQPGLNKLFSVIDTAITGTGAEFFTGLGRLITTLGGDVEGVTESEYVSRLMSTETLNSSQMMSGTLTDRDIDFLFDTVTRLGNTKEAIKFAFAQLEADKYIDQIIYSAYMKEEDKSNFDAASVIREVQPEVLRRVSEVRGVNLLGD